LILALLLKIHFSLHGTQTFSTLPTKARYWILSWVRLIQFTFSHPICLGLQYRSPVSAQISQVISSLHAFWQNFCMHFSSLRVCYMSHVSDHSNNMWWRVRIIKIRIMHIFFPLACCSVLYIDLQEVTWDSLVQVMQWEFLERRQAERNWIEVFLYYLLSLSYPFMFLSLSLSSLLFSVRPSILSVSMLFMPLDFTALKRWVWHIAE
jgi:hypothetical protein